MAELLRRPLSTNLEQALAGLDVGVQRERERFARRISAAEFWRRRDDQGLTELTLVEGERGTAQTSVIGYELTQFGPRDLTYYISQHV